MRSVIITSYKKNTDGAYHRHNRMDWTAAQRASRDAFHDASWADYSPLDYSGQPDTGVNTNPGALAGRDHAIFWCCSTPDAGVAGNAGDDEDLHGHADAVNQ